MITYQEINSLFLISLVIWIIGIVLSVIGYNLKKDMILLFGSVMFMVAIIIDVVALTGIIAKLFYSLFSIIGRKL